MTSTEKIDIWQHVTCKYDDMCIIYVIMVELGGGDAQENGILLLIIFYFFVHLYYFIILKHRQESGKYIWIINVVFNQTCINIWINKIIIYEEWDISVIF